MIKTLYELTEELYENTPVTMGHSISYILDVDGVEIESGELGGDCTTLEIESSLDGDMFSLTTNEEGEYVFVTMHEVDMMALPPGSDLKEGTGMLGPDVLRSVSVGDGRVTLPIKDLTPKLSYSLVSLISKITMILNYHEEIKEMYL